MPIRITTTDTVLDDDGARQAVAGLTALRWELNGLTGTAFLTPTMAGDVIRLPRGATFAGGAPADIAVFELTVPSIVLPTRDAQKAWMARGADIVHAAAKGRVPRAQIWGSVVHAVDGLWGIDGVAYDNAELGAAIGAAV
jgi:hypothetical protein